MKNKTPESQSKIRKRLAADLSDSDSTAAAENDANAPNKRQRTTTAANDEGSETDKAKTVTVLGREMTREEYEALKGQYHEIKFLVVSGQQRSIFTSEYAFRKLDFLYRQQTLIESSAVDLDSMGSLYPDPDPGVQKRPTNIEKS